MLEGWRAKGSTGEVERQLPATEGSSRNRPLPMAQLSRGWTSEGAETGSGMMGAEQPGQGTGKRSPPRLARQGQGRAAGWRACKRVGGEARCEDAGWLDETCLPTVT
jgi:hypothetical protein